MLWWFSKVGSHQERTFSPRKILVICNCLFVEENVADYYKDVKERSIQVEPQLEQSLGIR